MTMHDIPIDYRIRLPQKPAAAEVNPRLYNWHRYAPEPPALARPPDSGAYIPELSERLERDPNLTDGARRCARVIAGYAYRRDRDGRNANITVSYLQKALRKCRRTVQRYLRQLERSGYIETDVIIGQRSRMCTGLVLRLLTPLFPRHHKMKWPDKSTKSGATRLSQKHSLRKLISRKAWDERCRDGMFRKLCQTLPPSPHFFAAEPS